jgi:Raf kinase inhibitor-like YbhB/YbcL family protein
MRVRQMAASVAVSLALALVPARAQNTGFKLTSNDIKNGTFAPAQILNAMGCTGSNVSPELAWSGAPQGTKSFVLSIYDPDAPTGSGWWHWVVINIPASATGLPNGASKTAAKLPKGAVETRTDLGTPGYGGPCPPAGDKPHRYVFTLFALKLDKLDLTADSSAAMVGFMANANSLGKATFTATYGRK